MIPDREHAANEASARRAAHLRELSADQRRALESALLAKREAGGKSAGRIARRAQDCVAPLSSAQNGLWFLERSSDLGGAYNVVQSYRIRGALDVAALRRALAALVERHEILRTVFRDADGVPEQVVQGPETFDLALTELCDRETEDAPSSALRQIAAENARRVDLEAGPLFRARLLRVGVDDHVLILSTHHILTDEWSERILNRELAELYSAFATHRAPLLAPLRIQYADYAAWQSAAIADGTLDQGLSYWRKRLAGAPTVLSLPTDRLHAAKPSYRGARATLHVPREVTTRLAAVARDSQATMFVTMLAAFQALLYRYTGQEDFLVGAPFAGRTHANTEPLIGFFINSLPLRAIFSDGVTFRDLLRKTREEVLGAMEHQAVPLDQIVRALHPERNGTSHPLFQVMFSLESGDIAQSLLPGLDVSKFTVERADSKFSLMLRMEESGGRVIGSLGFDTDLFEPQTIERMARHFERLVAGFADDPDRRIVEMPLLSPAERDEIVVAWNRTETDYPRDASLQRLFEARVDATPGAIAVADGRARLTYAELDARANRLAHLLEESGVGPGEVVGLCLERSIELIFAMLAIVKAGGAYVPLDRSSPASRNASILDDTKAILLVTRSEFVPSIGDSPIRAIYLDRKIEDLARRPAGRPTSRATSEDLAYVIYTSGSTGQPKGVAVPQRAIARLVIGTNYASLSPATVVAHLSNVAFDAATFEIWGALLNGGRVEILDDETTLRPDRLKEAIGRRGINAMFLTTALFNQTANAVPDAFARLETLLVGGEPLDPRVCARVLEASPPRRLVNVYGPTEATTFATFYEIRRVPDGAVGIPIGRPIANTRLYVLGPANSPVPVGVAGELYIGGAGIARGYVNHPELTRARFVPDPFSQDPEDRLYRTGDRVRYRADGNIEFLGRLDRQVKIRGFRVEPAEIEAALLRHPQIAQAAVLVRDDESGGRRLFAYLVKRSEATPSAAEMRGFLRSTLPDYMIPAAFLWLDRLPLTANGKIDRSALPSESADDAPASTVMPRTPTERVVAEIWEQHLGRAPIAVDDDFFELGGHSLLAAKIFASLERRFGIILPLSLLFEAPTVSALAQAIERRPDGADATRVVAIQPRGQKNPIFGLAGAGGSVVGYALVARGLGDEQPFYGLELPGLEDGEVPSERIEAVATRFFEDIRHLHRDRPCVLIGACSGALVAFELARRLAADGRKIAWVVMIDPAPTGASRHSNVARTRAWRRLVVPRFVLGRIAMHARTYRSLDGKARREFLKEKGSVLKAIAQKRDLFRESRRELNLTRVREATIAALRAYAPSPYHGAVALMLGERYDSGSLRRTVSAWQEVCAGPLEVRRISGRTTGEMMQQPIVATLIADLERLLARGT